MAINLPTLLYRCYAQTSKRQLCSGKYDATRSKHTPLTDSDRLTEFNLHRNKYSEKPTALVSTTSSLLFAIRIAFSMSQYHDPDDIWLILVSPAESTVHSAYKLAEELKKQGLLENGKPSWYKEEWLFEWAIPAQNVIHTISLQTLIERGFTIPNLTGEDCIFAWSSELRISIQEHWKNRRHDDVVDACATAATCFGLQAPIGDLAVEIIGWTQRKGQRWFCNEVFGGIIDAVIFEYASNVGNDLCEHEADLAYLREAIASADDSYIDNVGDIVFAFPDTLERLTALDEAETAYDSERQKLQVYLSALNIKIGF